ncbi:hypothetical protein AVEN_248849-1 [Araneus ventricosus]|uniref:Uncharacterized protein n=1 Tax=Araneus ventricosus TaxID=182803 RepID=A0A4Y2QQ72_ARAVE|nr:hypothetical protein AVEN_248849-1 [Araneus ventricosus]
MRDNNDIDCIEMEILKQLSVDTFFRKILSIDKHNKEERGNEPNSDFAFSNAISTGHPRNIYFALIGVLIYPILHSIHPSVDGIPGIIDEFSAAANKCRYSYRCHETRADRRMGSLASLK